jgi:hypothetical protein
MPEIPSHDQLLPHSHLDFEVAGGVERVRPVSPPNVWLCADPPGASTAGLAPLWARRVIRALSERNERIIVRALRGYPGLAADAAALLRVAGATGRLPVALMPTPCLAARTRALLRTHETDDAVATDAAPVTHPRTAIEDTMATRPAPATERFTTADQVRDSFPANGHPAAAEAPAVTGQSAVTGRAAVTGESAVTEGFAAAEQNVATQWPCTRGPASGAVPAVVGVGRRRAGIEHGPAAAVIVLAGPVAAHARLPRRTMPSARLLGRWARTLEPGGVVGVLSPPPVGRHRDPGGRWEGSPAAGLSEVGLSWTDHIVLVHTPTTEHGLAHPDLPCRPELPFAQVHTCLDLFEADRPDLTDPAWADR